MVWELNGPVEKFWDDVKTSEHLGDPCGVRLSTTTRVTGGANVKMLGLVRTAERASRGANIRRPPQPNNDQLPPSERASKRPVLLLSFTRAIVDSLMGLFGRLPPALAPEL